MPKNRYFLCISIIFRTLPFNSYTIRTKNRCFHQGGTTESLYRGLRGL